MTLYWEKIGSAANEQLKQIRSLQQRKKRDESGLFIVEGTRAVQEALQSDWEVLFLVAADDYGQKAQLEELLRKRQQPSGRLLQVSGELLRKLGDTQTPQGIIAVVRQKYWELEQVLAMPGGGPLLVLDRVQDPGNVGALLRTAAALGAAGAVLLEGTTDAFSSKAVRAGMGAVFRLPVVQKIQPEFLNRLRKEQKLALWVAALEGGRPSYQADLQARHLLLLGNEGEGASAFWQEEADGAVFIPMPGGMESLNVAMAGSLLLYEAMRQRLSKEIK